jgi:O-succinylbenzoate synthase
MKIQQITIYNLRMPLVKPFETSFGRIQNRDCLLIEVVADGVKGYGECPADFDPGYSYETTQTAWHILKDFIILQLLQKEIKHPTNLPGFMSFVSGHPMAKAGLEMAIWDLYGKISDQSLRDMLGGIRKKVKVGVSVGLQESPKMLVRVVEGYLVDGYQRIKIKIKPDRDVVDTASVRSSFPEVPLQVDANSAYTLQDSGCLRKLDDFGLLMIEQPLAEDDLWDHRQLQKSIKTAICLDESILSVRHARHALEMQACRIINIKAGRVGGLTEAKAIHDYCLGLGIPVWCGGMLETGVGRASNLAIASLPGFVLPGDISATSRYYPWDITQERFVLNPDSTINVPDAPGLGILIDHKALEKATLRKQTYA